MEPDTVDVASKGKFRPHERVLEPMLKEDFLGRFRERCSHYQLGGLWPVIEGLLRLMPQQRISTSRALSMVIEVVQKWGLGTVNITEAVATSMKPFEAGTAVTLV